MTREVKTVTPETSVAEAAYRMHETGHGSLPVVNAAGRFLGIVTKFHLVRRCLPEYLDEVGDLFRSGDFQPFQDEVNEVGMLAVSEVMKKEVPTAEEDTPLAEVAALMVTRDVRQMPIVQDGVLVGIVGMQDIVDQIARITRPQWGNGGDR